MERNQMMEKLDNQKKSNKFRLVCVNTRELVKKYVFQKMSYRNMS